MPIYRMEETQPFISSLATEPFAMSEFRNGITYLYYMYDPTEDHAPVRYIGITGNPKARFQHHLSSARNQRDLREAWLYSVLNKGVEPIMEVRKMYLSRRDAESEERSWIRRLRARGFWLCNGVVSDRP